MAEAQIARDRFGLGARRGEAPPADPRRWTEAQIARFDPRPPALADAPMLAETAPMFRRYLAARRAMRAPAAEPAPADAAVAVRTDWRDSVRVAYARGVAARFAAAIASETPFVERLVHFWSNHFAVSVDELPVRALAASFEFEAIRPHVTGRFADLLRAAIRHPAMLYYLDQVQSFGPNSPAARQAGKARGLNENLAREILELHTLGVRTGYSQGDVTELARALTGWTVAGLAARPNTPEPEVGRFLFLAVRHEPGSRTVLGKTYPAAGADQGTAILDDLARHPATARHVATKLARHFAGDPVPPALVSRLATVFERSDGDLPAVYRALIASPEPWSPRPIRFRTPWEWAVAVRRALGGPALEPNAAVGLMDQLGQPVWRPGQPAGWDDGDAAWAGADAVMRRVEAAERIAAREAGDLAPRSLAATMLGDAISPATAQVLARAESPQQAIALLLVSPEAMRR